MAVAVIQGGEWGGGRMATAKRATDPMTSHPLTGCPPRVATRRHDCHSQSNDHTWNHLADDERALTPQARHAAQHTVEAPPEIYFWIRVSAASLFAWWWRIVSRICGGRSAEEFRHIVVRVRRICGGTAFAICKASRTIAQSGALQILSLQANRSCHGRTPATLTHLSPL